MINKQNLCIQCYEPISNPVCIDCHLREVAVWLRDQEMSEMVKSIILTGLKNRLLKGSINENMCIICDKHTLSTCSYCFFSVATTILKELNLPVDTIENFLETFNYARGYSDYAF